MTAEDRRFAVPLAELERAHVPREQQVETVPERGHDTADHPFDEQLRQVLLAPG